MRWRLVSCLVAALVLAQPPVAHLLLAGPVAAQEEMTAPIPMPRINRPDDSVVAPSGNGAETSATEAISALTSVPQAVHLDAKVMDASPQLTDGIVWRVFDTRTDETGELALVAKAETAVAELSLPPGEYVVHAAYGRAQASDNLTVEVGDNTKTVVLYAGGLRLNAAITGETAIPPGLLRFNIYSGSEEDANNLIVPNLRANEIVTLNAGTYHVVSAFGSVNAVVRANLRVEPGQLTDATLYHKASQISFKLVSEPGGEAIADIEWTVKTAAGETVFTDLGAFPSTVLAEGDYIVLAKRGSDVFNRPFEVEPGAAKEVEVLTAVY